MKPSALGSILPTAKSLALNDAHYDRITREQKRIASIHPILSKLPSVQVGDEIRYQHPSGKMAVVGFNSLRVLWFERRADGHTYSCKAPD